MLTVANTWKQVHEARIDTAIFAVGAIEQHGHHLPLGTDWYLADTFVRRLGEKLGNVLVLPAMPFGCSIEHIAFPGTITLRPATLAGVIEDVVTSLKHHGIKCVIVSSSHGGNWIIKPTLREINFRNPDILLLWVSGVLADEGESVPEDIHSGRSETSRMLACHPDLVRDHEAQPDSPGFLGQEFNDYAGYDKTTKTGAWGKPAEASAEAGQKMVDSAVDHCTRYVRWARERVQTLRNAPGCAPGSGFLTGDSPDSPA